MNQRGIGGRALLFLAVVSIFLMASCDKKDANQYVEGSRIINENAFLQDRFIDVPTGDAMVGDFTYLDLDKKSHQFSDLKGKVIFLNFWATWCEPCRHEMPAMEDLHFAMQGENFHLLAVNVGEKPELVKNFLKKFPYSFPMALDESKSIAEKLGIEGLPTTLFVNPEGKIVGKAMGPRKWNDKNLALYFKQIGKK